MGFNTFAFWTSFILFFVFYWTFLNRPSRLRFRNLSILIASYAFYASWDWRALFIIAASSLMSFGAAIMMAQSANRKKQWLSLSIATNLGFLAAFKYFDFFIESAELGLSLFVGETSFARTGWIVPVGMSFYTFQTMGYSIDVYRGRFKPVRDPVLFLSFVAFFPQLIAGPIERAKVLIPQFQKIEPFDHRAAKEAILLILWGLFKKLVIANRLAVLVDTAYANPSILSAETTCLIIVGFTIQLYCDFSGYCDVAIGVARLLGFKLSQNFNRPLLAASFQDLWRRWHITIHAWFRDYLFCHLNRKKTTIWLFTNMMIMFGISGLWHGASLNFLTWGLLNGLFLATIEPLVCKPFLKRKCKITRIASTLVASAFIYTSLIFFRGQDWHQSIEILSKLSEWSFPWTDFNEAKKALQRFGLGSWELVFTAIFIVTLLSVEILQETRHSCAASFWTGPGLGRWSAALLLMLTITFFGFYDDRVGLVQLNEAGAFFEAERAFEYEKF